jgi:hypothetical protein
MIIMHGLREKGRDYSLSYGGVVRSAHVLLALLLGLLALIEHKRLDYQQPRDTYETNGKE